MFADAWKTSLRENCCLWYTKALKNIYTHIILLSLRSNEAKRYVFTFQWILFDFPSFLKWELFLKFYQFLLVSFLFQKNRTQDLNKNYMLAWFNWIHFWRFTKITYNFFSIQQSAIVHGDDSIIKSTCILISLLSHAWLAYFIRWLIGWR